MDPMAAHYRMLLSHGRMRAVPLWFHMREQVDPDHLFFWDAFWDLSTERTGGMSPGPIPRSQLKAYADEHGFFGEEYQMFRRIIRTMDGIFQKMVGLKPKLEEDED